MTSSCSTRPTSSGRSASTSSPGGERPAELVADQVLAVFHDLYRENWGPRTQDILHAALLTLANKPGMTLCALPVLLSNPRFRRKAVAGLTDEVALKPFWAWFESLSARVSGSRPSPR